MAKLKDLSVQWISLVKEPANAKPLVLKSGVVGANQTAVPFSFTKFEQTKSDDGERMVAYGVVYSPNQVDLQGDYTDVVTIRRAAYDFMRNGRLHNIDEEHDFDAKEASIVESYILRKNDALFPNEPEGSWVVGIQVRDPELWGALKSGDLTGVSLAGFSRETQEFETEVSTKKGSSMPEIFKQFYSFMKQINQGDTNNGDNEMTEDEIKAVATTAATAAAGEVVKNATPNIVAETLKSMGVKTKNTSADDDKNDADSDNANGDAAAVNSNDSTVAAIEKGFATMTTTLENTILKSLAKGSSETGVGAHDEGCIL